MNNGERKARLDKYIAYRDRVLKGETLTLKENKEYRILEAEFCKNKRPIVTETEADSLSIGGTNQDFHSIPREQDTPLKSEKLFQGMNFDNGALADDSLNDFEMVRGGATPAAQAYLLGLSQEDYEYLSMLNIDGVYYGTRILSVIQKRRASGEDYMEIVEAAKDRDVEKLNKLLSNGIAR